MHATQEHRRNLSEPHHQGIGLDAAGASDRDSQLSGRFKPESRGEMTGQESSPTGYHGGLAQMISSTRKPLSARRSLPELDE